MKKIFDDMENGPFKAKVDERFHKLGQDCPDDGWVTGYLLRDLHKGEVLPHIFNCPCTWIVKEETIEPVGFHIAQWIKVEDRLPKRKYGLNITHHVLVSQNGNSCEVAFYSYKERDSCWYSTMGWRIENVTHWQEIVPPKED